MSTLRIFISSPGDVAEERDKAEAVIRDLDRYYSGRAQLVAVRWEKLGLGANASFQEGIVRLLSEDGSIQVAVFILWSRLGTPQGDWALRPDGRPYRSGTEQEFDLMLEACRNSGGKTPVILAYVREDDRAYNAALTAAPVSEHSKIVQQRSLAREFISETFTDAATGRNLRAFHPYDQPVTFADRLRVHLRDVLDRLIGEEAGAVRWDQRPYRGLEVFDIAHEDIFRGREEQVLEVLHQLRLNAADGCAFAVLVGASGSGKSSLARAGVVPSLLHHAHDGARQWRHAIFTPSLAVGAPLAGLVQVLVADGALPELPRQVEDVADLAHCLAVDPEGALKRMLLPALRAAREAAGGPVRLILVVDQMEELFVPGRITDEERAAFLRAIEVLARHEEPGNERPFRVLATLRSDFYAAAQRDEIFLRLKGRNGHCDLPPPDPAALHRIVVEPARLAGIKFEERDRVPLDRRLLAEAVRGADALPLLEYALDALYERRDTTGAHPLLTHAAYEAMGGVEGALGGQAEKIFSNLPEDARAAFGPVMQDLVTVDASPEAPPLRQRVLLTTLRDAPAKERLVDALLDARFLTADSDTRTGAPVAGLAHEALLRRWDRLALWIDANREQLRVRARVEQAQALWERSDAVLARRDSSLLLPEGLPLEEARGLLRSTLRRASTADYILASIAHHEAAAVRRRRLRRNVLVALSLLLVVAVVAAGWAGVKQKDAREQAARAVSAKNAADELIRYMQVDLSDTLGKLGHLEMMGGINERVRKYYKDHPAEAGDIRSLRGNNLSSDQLGDILFEQGDTVGALQCYRESLAGSKQLAKQDPDPKLQSDIGNSYLKVGDVQKAQGDTVEALESYRESLSIFERLVRKDPANPYYPPGLSSSYMKIGEVQSAQGNLDSALQSYRNGLATAEARAKQESDKAESQRHLSVCYDRVGDLQIEQGDLVGALKSYRDGLAIADKLAKQDPSNAEWQNDVSISYAKVGGVQSNQGDSVGALQSYRDALAIAEKLAKQDPSNSRWQRGLATNYMKVGEIHKDDGDLTGALQSNRQSLAILENLAKQDPGNADSQRNLSVGYSHMGDVQSAQDDFAGALQSYRESLIILEKLAKQDLSNAEWQRDLSIGYSRIGAVQSAEGDHAGALQSYRDSLAMSEKLAKQDPSNAIWQRDLALSYDHIGDMQSAQSNHADALQSYRESLAIFEKLAKQDPSNAQYQRDLWFGYAEMGALQSAQNDLPGALQSYRESLAVREKLAKQDPGNPEYQRHLAIGLQDLGMEQCKRGNMEGLQSLRDSQAILEKLAEQNPEYEPWQSDVPLSYLRLAEISEKNGDAVMAAKDFKKGDQVAIETQHRGMLAPENQWIASKLAEGVGRCYDRVGDMQRAQSDHSGALQSYRESLASLEKLGKQDPSNADWQRKLAIGYAKMGALQSALNDLAGALESYRESLAVREKLAKLEPDNPEYQRYLAIGLQDLGEELCRRGNMAGLQSLRDSQVILEKLAKQYPGNAPWQSDVVLSYLRLAEIAERNGDTAMAADYFKKGDAVAIETQRRGMLAPENQWMANKLAEGVGRNP